MHYFSTSVPVFAQDSISTDIQNEQNKIVSYIGEYKLVLWELGNIVYAEQYDSQGTLIVSGNANKTNGEINIFNNNTYSKFNATEIVETISTNLLPTTYSFKRVGTYKYIITDEESKKLNEVYYTTNAYYDPAEGPTPMLMQFIVPNLYGTEYEWAQSI